MRAAAQVWSVDAACAAAANQLLILGCLHVGDDRQLGDIGTGAKAWMRDGYGHSQEADTVLNQLGLRAEMHALTSGFLSEDATAWGENVIAELAQASRAPQAWRWYMLGHLPRLLTHGVGQLRQDFQEQAENVQASAATLEQWGRRWLELPEDGQ